MADNNLHVPQKAAGTAKSVRDIMAAYNSQSKIQLYDDSSAMSNDGVEGVGGRNIPLAALRPRQVVQDENGRPVPLPRGTVMAETKSIASAYNKMRGVEESDDEGLDLPTSPRRAKNLPEVPRFKAEYVEDMPETDEGLLEVLELAIRNARANLEMLESLYAALCPEA